MFIDLLLHQIPIIFYCFTPEKETEQIREIYDYAEYLPLIGKVSGENQSSKHQIHTFTALLDILNNEDSFHISIATKNEYQLLQNIFWQAHHQDAFENIENYLFSR